MAGPSLFGWGSGQGSLLQGNKPAGQDNKLLEQNLGQQAIEEADPPDPYLAEGEDAYGRPYYGPGVRGYVKKLFANIFDPDFYVPQPSKRQAELIEQGAQVGGEMLNDLTGWDKWIGSWTGIQASDVARGATAIRMTGMEVDEEGNPIEQSGAETAIGAVQAGAKFFYKAGSQGIAVGLDALGLIDKGSRFAQATALAVDDIGNSSSVLPEVTLFDDTTKFGSIANTLLRLTPPVMAYNGLRMLTNGKSLAENYKTIKDYRQGADMLYTMYWDHAKKQEYFRRLKAGENPELLEIELQNPWVELAGSVAGDPSTYLGMGIIGQFGKAKTAVKIPFTQKVLFNLPWKTVGRVPGLSEIFHLKNVGKMRLASSADLFTKVATPELEGTLRKLENVVDDRAALSALKGAVEQVGQTVKKMATTYGFFVGDASAKADVMKKTVGTSLRAIASTFRDGDDVGEFVKAAKNITSADPRLASEALSTLKQYGNLPFSEGGMRMLNYISKMDDEIQIATLLEKHADNLPELAKVLEDKVFKIVDESFPSVADMEKAAQEIKTLGKNLDLGGEVKKGDYTRKLELAKEYQRLPQWVKRSTKVYAGLVENKVYRGLQGFFAGTYMGLSPAYALRNLQNNTVTIWHDLGTKVAGEAFAKGAAAAVPLKGDDIAKAIIKAEADKAAKLLGGAVPTTLGKGVGQAGVDTAFGALAVGARIEQVQSAVIVRNVVETEIEKMLRYGTIPDVPNLPAESANRLKQLVLENYGDTKAALKTFRQEVKSGEFEVFRSLPLDSNFKDWLRKVNKLDELEEIRRTAKSADEFVDRMKAFTGQLEDLARRVADEPAQVSDSNPMGEAVVQIERAIANDNVLGREEISQFKAMTELYDQMRLSYQNVAKSLQMQLSRMLPESSLRQFDDMFSKINVEFNEVVGGARDLATNFYEGAYQQSRKGKPASELWDTVKAVVLDENGNMVRVSLRQAFPDIDPSQLNRAQFQRMAWRWVKDTQSKFWRNYNQSFVMKQDSVLQEMARAAGTTLDEVKASYFGGADNPKLVELERLYGQIKEWEEYVSPAALKPFENVPAGTKLTQMDLSTTDFPGGKTHLFNAVNKERAAKGMDTYATIDDVPFEEAVTALKGRLKPIPPHVGSTTPTTARQLYENLNGGARDALNEFVATTVKKWGETVPVTDLGDEAEAGIAAFSKEMDKRMVTTRAAAMAIADETRNFILHDYNKSYGDKFFGMFLQYHYWPSRTYARWLERAIDTPGTLSAYVKWKDAMDKIHADQPEYFRYQVPIGKLLGMQDNPMYFNLEQTLNPIYGLTGTDFNDPYRRGDWISSTLDDLGKFGFGTFTPLQWLVAANLYRKGEDEAGQRWIGRLIPQTQHIKAGLNVLEEKTGIDLMPSISALPGAKYGEFDPFVNVFGGGVDPYEEKRIGRALANMIRQNPAIKEQAFDELLNREGELYDQAVQNAILERSGGQMASYFLGLGYKTRTEGDILVDQFYTKYYKLLSIREQVSPEAYRDAFDQLKEEYPFADAILLSKRGGDDRDGAYAYNVLSRVPPGQYITDRHLIDKFYEDKGNFSDWSEQDKSRFMADILDAGALLKMPELATRQDWNEARDINSAIYTQVEGEMGEEIWDIVNAYYELKDTDAQAAVEFKEDHPEIAEALTRRMELLQQNPDAFQYFSSLDNLEYYIDGKVRAQLKEKYGDLAPLWKDYFDLKLRGDNKGAKMLFKLHPELSSYSAEKKRLTEEANREFVRVAALLPEREYLTLREDIDQLSQEQEALLASLQPESVPSWGEIVQVTGEDMSPAMQTILQGYWSGELGRLPSAAESQLEYLASRYGNELGASTPESFLRLVGLALQQPQQQAQGPGVTQPSLFGP